MSNLARRVLTAVVAIPIIIIICLMGGWYFFSFVVLLSAIGLYEFYGLAKAKGANPQAWVGLVVGFLVNLSFFSTGRQVLFTDVHSEAQFFFLTLIVSVAVVGLIELFRNSGSAIQNTSSTLAGVLYVSLFFGTLIGIREAFDEPNYHLGGSLIIAILVSVWLCDTAAFQVGIKFGKHKLFPRVSPNKSWEGTFAGFLFAIIGIVGMKYLIVDYLPLSSALFIGIVVGVFGQLGDLFESLLKRDAGVKDSSQIIPGHGGVLDRFDSLLLVSPIVYLYLVFSTMLI